MDLTGIIDTIDTIPAEPDLELETYHDNRTKAFLLHKKGNERLEVLIVPFGENLKGKKDISYYMSIKPGRSVKSMIFQDAKIEQHELKNGYSYLTISDELRKVVVPYKIKGELPYKILQSSFTKRLVECNEMLLNTIIKGMEEMRDVINWLPFHIKKEPTKKETETKEVKTFEEVIKNIEKNLEEIRERRKKPSFEKTKEMLNLFGQMYQPLKEELLEAFQDVNVDSQELPFLERKTKHYHLQSIEKYFFKTKDEENDWDKRKRKLKLLLVDPLKHIITSTEENKIGLNIMPNKKTLEGIAHVKEYLKSENIKAYEGFEWAFQLHQKIPAFLYHSYLFLGSGISAALGNPGLGLGLLGLLALEVYVSRNNQKKTGYNTSTIGTLRDKLGITVKAPEKNKISNDYDLGMWNKEDLEKPEQ
ncbi:hypothetical protein HZA97_00215 [Candidatus Woesearchaeota archaeon]|nr:hypothetical protein [Candidatus Woesearchaeota archaeon]